MKHHKKFTPLIILSLILLTSCAPFATAAAQRTHIVVLWHTFTGAEATALHTLTDQFNKVQQNTKRTADEPRIILITEYQHNLLGKLTAAQNAPPPLDGDLDNSLPDLIIVWPEDITDYMKLGLTVNERAWPSDIRNRQSDILPMAQALYSVNGTMQALPLGLATYALYYNTEWLSDLGYNAARAGWGDLRGVACAATDPLNRQVGLGLPTRPHTLLALLTAGDAAITDASGFYAFADPAGINTAGKINEILGGGCAAIYNEPSDLATRLSQGGLALIVESSLNRPAIEQSIIDGRNFTLGLSAIPAPTGPGRTLWYGPGLMLISPTNEQQPTAGAVLSWLFGVDAQTTWSTVTDYLPIRRSLVEHRRNTAIAQSTETHPSPEIQLLTLTLAAVDEAGWVAWPRHTNTIACRASLLHALLSLGGQAMPGAYIEAAALACNSGLGDSP